MMDICILELCYMLIHLINYECIILNLMKLFLFQLQMSTVKLLKVFRKFLINISPRDVDLLPQLCKVFDYEIEKLYNYDEEFIKVQHRNLSMWMEFGTVDNLKYCLNDECFNDDVINYIVRMYHYYNSLDDNVLIDVNVIYLNK